ncbi:Tannase [Dactylellina cionopaga]|nr:Tannase [Dactylellina cionopaga]
MKVNSVLGALSLAFTIAFATPHTSFNDRCSGLASTFSPGNTHVLLAGYVATGTNITFPESANNTCPKFVIARADMCRLRLNVTTSSTSSVIVEAFMPVDWTSKGRRFLMTGNGGLGGCIPYGDMAFGTKLGFAVIGHNNGHAGDTGVPFYNRPQVVKDYAWRALYIAGKIGKRAVNHFYTGRLEKSYYAGCSSGGRQGMYAAQNFPDEYDGIISAAPAINYQSVIGSGAYIAKAVGPVGAPNNLNLDQWNRVHRMVVEQCDWIDGVLDGVLEDPMKCQPRPEALLCGPGEMWTSHHCLTAPQVAAVRKVYEPAYGNHGRLISPRLNPLTREFLGYRFLYGGTAGYLGEEYYRYALFNDPTWNIADDWNLGVFDYDMAKDLFGVSTSKTDLTDMKNNRTKLLMYHGLSDGLITSENSIKYYNDVSKTMGLPPSQLDEFYRFFPISGLDHCYTGDGAWFVGGPVQVAVAGALDVDPSDGVLMTMVNWVENNDAPETLTGRKLVNGAVVAEKAHCRYPAKTTYKGNGLNPSLASSWECNTAQV